MSRPLAHSAPRPDRNNVGPQTYENHASGVAKRSKKNAEQVVGFAPHLGEEFCNSTIAAGEWHDLGKLIAANQLELQATGRRSPLPEDHSDAGAAHLFAIGADWAATLVLAHHRPGLPDFEMRKKVSKEEAFVNYRTWRLRERGKCLEEAREFVCSTDAMLPALVAKHEAECGTRSIARNNCLKSLAMRIALSCLVDADHSDTSEYANGGPFPSPPECRWEEREAALERYVAEKFRTSDADAERKEQIQAFYEQCRSHKSEPLVSSEGPVGIGKTTALLAYAIRTAITDKLRRIIVVAPYTAIIDQTVKNLREALTLPGEDPEAVVAAHHHLVDYDDLKRDEKERKTYEALSGDVLKGFAQVWRSPVVVTTSVQFFETLAAASPVRLRKLHSLPGSIVVLDEAHATLPMTLWPLAWRWLNQAAKKYSCRIAFSSGTLVKFWEWPEFANSKGVSRQLPLLADGATSDAKSAESRRVRLERIADVISPTELIDRVRNSEGPRLVIVNTTASAAAFARELLNELGGKEDDQNKNVVHISTLLCPKDRERIVKEVEERLKDSEDTDWTLVATSCVEAGVDFSFRTGFREAWSLSSLLQTAGRVNRRGNHSDSVVFSFELSAAPPYAAHAQVKIPARILNKLFEEGQLEPGFDPTIVATEAAQRELRNSANEDPDLVELERDSQFPKVAEQFRVIDDDGAIPVVVDADLIAKLESNQPVRSVDFERGSVSLSPKRIEELAICELEKRPGILALIDRYDKDFLGAGAAILDAFAAISLDILNV